MELIREDYEGLDYPYKTGKFEVIYEKDNIKTFSGLRKAIKFYESLQIPCAIWDVTRGAEILQIKKYNS